MSNHLNPKEAFDALAAGKQVRSTLTGNVFQMTADGLVQIRKDGSIRACPHEELALFLDIPNLEVYTPAPSQHTGWINVYPTIYPVVGLKPNYVTGQLIYDTEEAAKQAACKRTTVSDGVQVKITWETSND